MEEKNKNTNKKQIAYEHLRQLILDGTYGSGQRIIIDQIAKELRLSPIPVREAIRQLESDGLIHYKPYSGAVVTSINESEYIETLSVLSLLEGYAAALSSLTMNDQDFDNLINLNKEMEKALHNFELELFGKLNECFHAEITEKCGNSFLMEEIKQSQQRMNRVRKSMFTMVPQRAVQSIREHESIIKLLQEKASFEDIESLVRKHKLNAISTFKQRADTNRDQAL
ncbi:GntR family transcriptional regulator [Bacillus sp. mrc49]|uniref:GntR family transcriptional regulator n=1 Tax=Bacillus sp. mrc49 TaxID=2054913 RepID=UPI000C27B7A4|nr:GntR family transcriptional regulator [Bacillus sp. mrc49]PJN90038.1 GntR family transcriptional regulator [Bacillus sp. mrc49]